MRPHTTPKTKICISSHMKNEKVSSQIQKICGILHDACKTCLKTLNLTIKAQFSTDNEIECRGVLNFSVFVKLVTGKNTIQFIINKKQDCQHCSLIQCHQNLKKICLIFEKSDSNSLLKNTHPKICFFLMTRLNLCCVDLKNLINIIYFAFNLLHCFIINVFNAYISFNNFVNFSSTQSIFDNFKNINIVKFNQADKLDTFEFYRDEISKTKYYQHFKRKNIKCMVVIDQLETDFGALDNLEHYMNIHCMKTNSTCSFISIANLIHWPKTIEELNLIINSTDEICFLNEKVEKQKIFATSFGALVHEFFHLMDVGHLHGGLMSKEYYDIEKFFKLNYMECNRFLKRFIPLSIMQLLNYHPYLIGQTCNKDCLVKFVRPGLILSTHLIKYIEIRVWETGLKVLHKDLFQNETYIDNNSTFKYQYKIQLSLLYSAYENLIEFTLKPMENEANLLLFVITCNTFYFKLHTSHFI
ncbi:hypothetical protein A3Q56_02771 [Intoshia linei]|uniref:Uncharacterized protein n=1 Tax=Intoshia linei TaxID=1819745 RepID=A0A177B796_9BILA|nr:hypothetical protein A3Q56_02771 [Intoshia linei]